MNRLPTPHGSGPIHSAAELEPFPFRGDMLSILYNTYSTGSNLPASRDAGLRLDFIIRYRSPSSRPDVSSLLAYVP